jgi:hypothetical protein
MSMRSVTPWAVAVYGCVAGALAQEGAFEQLVLRVSSVRPDGSVVVDRGRRDQVQVGDRVVLAPRTGQSLLGAVTQVEERTALVELVDRNAVVAPGTRGHALLPRGRTAPAKPPVGAQPAQPGEPRPAPPPPRDDWRPGMPLLGTTRPPRPEERAANVRGRAYAAGNLVRTLDSSDQSFVRAGIDVDVANLHGDGGLLRAHVEYGLLTETNDRTGEDLRVFELSYAYGGTRFDPLRWQVGRFWAPTMPEFGLLDGVEVAWRRESGLQFGGSFGWLPELDEDLATGEDLQVALWALWPGDVGHRFTIGGGLQKTWHNGEPDRDLLVAKVRFLPLEGWDVSGVVWIDLYTASDDLHASGVQISRANLSTRRSWLGAGGLGLAYDHEEYPELLRDEPPAGLLPATLQDAHQDRLTGNAHWQVTTATRWRARATGWTDEQRDGGAVEIGFDTAGLVQAAARTGLTAFQVQGLSSSQFGLRVDHGGDFAFGRVDLLYELGFVHHEGFPGAIDDLLQHRLGGMWTTSFADRWSGSLHADATLWDEELSLGLGLWLQRSF